MANSDTFVEMLIDGVEPTIFRSQAYLLQPLHHHSTSDTDTEKIYILKVVTFNCTSFFFKLRKKKARNTQNFNLLKKSQFALETERKEF